MTERHIATSPQQPPAPPVNNEGDLTADQIAYLHELAEERRKVWLEAKRVANVHGCEVVIE